jgi:uncharacterized membrane protein
MRRRASWQLAAVVALALLWVAIIVAWAFARRWAQESSHSWWVVTLVVISALAFLGGLEWLRRRYDL